MKTKYILIMCLIALGVTSCSLDDDNNTPLLQLEAVAVTDVEFPEPFVFGEVNDIIVKYDNPSDCNRFYAFDVRSDLNEREITVFTSVFDDNDCNDEDVPTEQVLRFRPISNGTIEFKFFSGLDEDGEKEFLEYTIDVQE